MKIINTTNICDELIKAIALDVGLDLNSDYVLEIEYSTVSKAVQDGTNGGFWSHGNTLGIVIRPDAPTRTLAHELRHAYQCQVMGKDIFDVIYDQEMELVGYQENVLEIDAREAGERWKV